LASVRRIVSNYVDILTGTSVPVYFKAMGDSYNVGGQEIYITTAIKKKKDFDNAVGLALHEAAHTVLTDFDLTKTIPFNTPKIIWEFAKKNNIRKATMERFLKTMHNIVEDWYIDDWVINKAPDTLGIMKPLMMSVSIRPPSTRSSLATNTNIPVLSLMNFALSISAIL